MRYRLRGRGEGGEHKGGKEPCQHSTFIFTIQQLANV